MSGSKHVLFTGGYATADQPGIQAFDFDAGIGRLTSRSAYTGITNPSFLVVHENGRWLYAVSEVGMGNSGQYGEVWAFSIDPQTFELQFMNKKSTRGDWPCHLAVDGSGRWLLASNYGSGDVALFPILDDGMLGEIRDFVQHEGQGPNQARQEGPHAHSATLTLDNRFVIVADLGIDQLVVYALDAAAGKLNPHHVSGTRPGAGPRHAVFSHDGQRLYVANELDCTVSVYEFERLNGTMRELQTLDTLPPSAPETIVADIHISADGQRLYVSNRGHNSVAVFGVGADGLLTQLAVQTCGGKWPRNFTLAPGGRFMLVANEQSDEITVLPIQVGGSEIGAPAERAAATRPTCIQWFG